MSIYIFFQPASFGIQIFPSGGTSGNAVLIWIEQFRSFHLLNVSFSLCDSVLLRYFELLLHPQPTILSISTIVRPIGVNVLILSVSTQSKVLRRFRLFEYLFDLEIGLLEHWLFGRWLKIHFQIFGQKRTQNLTKSIICFIDIGIKYQFS